VTSEDLTAIDEAELGALLAELADHPVPEEVTALFRCRWCGRWMDVQRSTKRFCDTTCRKAAWRARLK